VFALGVVRLTFNRCLGKRKSKVSISHLFVELHYLSKN